MLPMEFRLLGFVAGRLLLFFTIERSGILFSSNYSIMTVIDL